MIKAHLDAEQLKEFKKDELVQLAKDLGVESDGTKEEIAARIAAIEVEVPEEHELTADELKEIRAAEAEAKAKAEAEAKAKAEAEAKAKKPETVRVECIQTYKDLELKRTVRKGTTLNVSKDRARVLLDRKLVKKA